MGFKVRYILLICVFPEESLGFTSECDTCRPLGGAISFSFESIAFIFTCFILHHLTKLAIKANMSCSVAPVKVQAHLHRRRKRMRKRCRFEMGSQVINFNFPKEKVNHFFDLYQHFILYQVHTEFLRTHL